jgi:excisionase family DNA binding protein
MKLSPRVYTLAETADVLHIHPITVRRLIKRRVLSRVMAIRDIRIPVEDVDRLLKSPPPHQ